MQMMMVPYSHTEDVDDDGSVFTTEMQMMMVQYLHIEFVDDDGSVFTY